jgi:hypothetical protein
MQRLIPKMAVLAVPYGLEFLILDEVLSTQAGGMIPLPKFVRDA